MADRGPLLLKVPKWISEAWLAAPPESVVANLDLEAGIMHLAVGSGSPAKTLAISRRSSPELFTYPTGNGEVTVEGAICEAFTVNANVHDAGYKDLAQKRLHEAQITSGNRTLGLEKIIQPDQRPERETISGTMPLMPQELYELSKDDGPPPAEVAAAVSECLKAAGQAGVTCEQMLEQLPNGCNYIAVRDALAALAELREVRGERRFVYGPLYLQRKHCTQLSGAIHTTVTTPPPAARGMRRLPDSEAAAAPPCAPATALAAAAPPLGPLLKRKR